MKLHILRILKFYSWPRALHCSLSQRPALLCELRELHWLSRPALLVSVKASTPGDCQSQHSWWLSGPALLVTIKASTPGESKGQHSWWLSRPALLVTVRASTPGDYQGQYNTWQGITKAIIPIAIRGTVLRVKDHNTWQGINSKFHGTMGQLSYFGILNQSKIHHCPAIRTINEFVIGITALCTEV